MKAMSLTTSTETMNDTSLLVTALQAAIDAGKQIMEIYNGPFDVEVKSDLSPLTIADRQSHEIIKNALSTTGIPMLSEEGSEIEFSERKSWPRYWLVDPLDGTKEFVKRNGEFTVNIALIEDNRPVMGIIYVPVTDVLYYGIMGSGSYRLLQAAHNLKNGSPSDIRTSAHALPIAQQRKFTIVSSRSHMSAETESFVNSLKEKHGDAEFLSKGSSLKICLVAEGSADVYPRLAPTMEWDTAAGEAIALAAGCTVINHFTGAEMIYNKEHLLNPHFIVYGRGFQP